MKRPTKRRQGRCAVISSVFGREFRTLYPAPDRYPSFLFSNNPELEREARDKGWRFELVDLPLLEDVAASSLQSKYVKFLQVRNDSAGSVLQRFRTIFYADHKFLVSSESVDALLKVKKAPVLVRMTPRLKTSVWDEVDDAKLQERYTRFMPETLAYIEKMQSTGHSAWTRICATGLIIYDTHNTRALKLADRVYRDVMEIGTSECQIVWALVAQEYADIIQAVQSDRVPLLLKQPELAVPVLPDPQRTGAVRRKDETGKKTMVVNTFWYGSALSLYEQACLSSWVRNGIAVRVYSFDPNLEVPFGVELADAGQLAQLEEIGVRTQDGVKGSLSSFSNIFRYRLLSREAGWWVDADVFCLASEKAFHELQRRSPGMVVGRETETSVNNAVMYVSDCDIARDLERMALEKGSVLQWGEIGPKLVTHYYHTHTARVAALPPAVFYPTYGWRKIDLLYDPDGMMPCVEAASASLCVHLGNYNLKGFGIPKNVMPCTGSYLEALFVSVGTGTSCARLPREFFRLPQQIMSLAGDNARLTEENARLTEENARLTEENARLTEENARLAEENARLAEENAGLREESMQHVRKMERLYASGTWRCGSAVRALGTPLRPLRRVGMSVLRTLKGL